MTKDRSHCNFFDLSLDIKYVILDYLDNRSLACLAKTCRYFASLVRNIISFRNVHVNMIDIHVPKAPPFLNYRAGVSVGSTFYMPFINESSLCYTFDLNTGIWSSHKLNLIDMIDIQPQITSAAVIGTKIYLVCGRLLKSYTLSNGLIEIDITNFNTRMIKDAEGLPPRPRHEHSVDAVGGRFLIVFGGLCYNSVGENDVFVYDIFENRWFVPPISGHVPHLRFGHASAVIGTSLYIHGGAQLDNDSSYIVYDDLYKLDCQTWVWYKYEHPEVERYLRSLMPTSGESPQRNHLISTTGDSPNDRFQSYMCAYGNKLIIFGGHSIREDQDDNEILCSYPIDELCIFNTKRRAWSMLSATTNEEEEESITVSDMSVAMIPMDSRGIRIYIFAGKKAAEIPRSDFAKPSMSSSTNGSGYDSISVNQHQAIQFLPSITENVSPTQSLQDDESTNDDKSGDMATDGRMSSNEQSNNTEVRTPDGTRHAEQVKDIFDQEPDMENMRIEKEEYEEDEEDVIYKARPSTSGNNSKLKRKRPSISVIHHETEEGDLFHIKTNSSSSHSSYSSSSGSLGHRNSKYLRKATPCIVMLDIIE